mmetsp:Transcript_21364/g.36467  ORF Transcript_21364/g.36467 Transcript_21364/m.36467 type:complete len:207 (-) Transcript_21364:370-990(-)
MSRTNQFACGQCLFRHHMRCFFFCCCFGCFFCISFHHNCFNLTGFSRRNRTIDVDWRSTRHKLDNRSGRLSHRRRRRGGHVGNGSGVRRVWIHRHACCFALMAFQPLSNVSFGCVAACGREQLFNVAERSFTLAWYDVRYWHHRILLHFEHAIDLASHHRHRSFRQQTETFRWFITTRRSHFKEIRSRLHHFKTTHTAITSATCKQ